MVNLKNILIIICIFLITFFSLNFTNTSLNIKDLKKEDLTESFFKYQLDSKFDYIDKGTLNIRFANEKSDIDYVKANPHLFYRELTLNDDEEIFITFTLKNYRNKEVDDDIEKYVYVDLYDKYSSVNSNKSKIKIPLNKMEVRKKLQFKQKHSNEVWVRFFTNDNIQIKISDISIWKYSTKSRVLENVIFSFLLAIGFFLILKFKSTKLTKVFLLLFLVVNITLLSLFLIHLNNSPRTIIGDEAVYIAQANSLAYDLDNQYTDKDIVRYILTINEMGPISVFVNFYNGNYFFSKTMLYALTGAPFVRIFGANGLEVLNFFSFIGLIVIGYMFLKRRNNTAFSFIFSLLFNLLSVGVAYIFESYIDLYNAFILGIAFLIFTKYLDNYQNNNIYLYLSSFLFGIIGYSRTPYLSFVFFCMLRLLFDKKFGLKKVFLYGIIVFISFGAFNLYHITKIGCYSPYGGERYLIRQATFEQVNPVKQTTIINKHILKYLFPMTISEKGIINNAKIALSDKKAFFYNFIYFFIGWHTGALIYFPCFFLLIFNFRFKDLKDNLYILLGIIGHIMFFMLQGYNNYFGGSHSLGNRYFLQVLVSFLFLVPKISIKRTLVGLIVSLSVFSYFLDVNMSHKLRDILDFRATKNLQVLPKEYTQFDVISDLGSSVTRKIFFDNGSYIWLGFKKDNYIIEDKKNNMYWTKGRRKQHFVVVTKKPLDSVTFFVSSGPINNEIKLSDNRVISLKDNQRSNSIKINLKLKHKFYNKYYYEFTLKPKYSFIPKEVTPNARNDVRNLGVSLSNFELQYE